MNNIYLLEESSKTEIPETFKTLIHNVMQERSLLIKTEKSVLEIFSLDNDYIVSVVGTVALESGFRLNSPNSANFDAKILHEFTTLKKSRDPVRKVYQLDFKLDQLAGYSFGLLAVPLGRNAIIMNFLTLKNGTAVRSSAECLVPSQWLNVLQNQIAERFMHLPRLARCCRTFLLKARDMAFNDERVPNPSFLGIPEELKLKIFKHLVPKDFIHLNMTCKAMNAFAKNSTYWKHRLRLDYKAESEHPMETYIEKYITRKIVQKQFAESMSEILTRRQENPQSDDERSFT